METSLFVKDLTVIDFSYLHPLRGVLGESWIVDVEINGELNQQSFIFDFGLVKKVIKKFIDQEFDHKLWVPQKSSQVKQLDLQEDKSSLEFHTGQDFIVQYTCPQVSLFVYPHEDITREEFASYLNDRVMEVLPDNVESVILTLREESLDTPYYHYSHGLKKHDGNCQRMIHGHRSKIEIYKNSLRSLDLEKVWSDLWEDIYLISKEDLVEEKSVNGVKCYVTKYVSGQGEFSLVISKDRCYILDLDSTVECISMHIWKKLSDQYPDDAFVVHAFEGVGKGAITRG